MWWAMSMSVYGVCGARACWCGVVCVSMGVYGMVVSLYECVCVWCVCVI